MRPPRARASCAAGFAAAALVASACAPAPSAAPPNLLLVTLDTTRPDHLGLYGYARDTSPRLDRLASGARVFTRAYSTSSWTLPAHASLFTGRLPSGHGARYDPEGPLVLADAIAGSDAFARVRVRGLGAGIPTLAELLAGAGYATAGVVAGPWLAPVFGLARGFQHYDAEGVLGLAGAPASSVTARALAWLDGEDFREPFFLFANYFDPHAPYAPPAAERARFAPEGPGELASTRALYDGEIRYADRELGRLLDALEERGRLARTLLVVTSDHGEQFGEHGLLGHGYTLFEEEIRIPLLIRDPQKRIAAGRDAAPISLADVFALLCERLGVAAPAPDAARDPEPPILAETYPLPRRGSRGHWRALLQGRFKYLWSSAGPPRLYDLGADPDERLDLAARQPERTRALGGRLEQILATLPRPPPATGSPTPVPIETRRALESLGYLPPE